MIEKYFSSFCFLGGKGKCQKNKKNINEKINLRRKISGHRLAQLVNSLEVVTKVWVENPPSPKGDCLRALIATFSKKGNLKIF